MEIGLADRDVVAVERGDPAVARFDALPGRAFPGRVTRIGAAADPTTGTYLVEVTLDEGGALAAGLVGTVEIRPKRGTPTALVPIESVLEADGSEATVYALSDDGARALRRRVTVAFIDGSRVAIADGLNGASRVLTDGAAYLDDGAAVRVAPCSLLEFPVRRWQFTVVLFAMLAALGVSSWLTIPRGEDPPLYVPTFTVVAVYPGASPADLERLVVRDIEERLDALENVEEIRSRIQDGVATVTVEFDFAENPDDRYDEVVREVNALRPELPQELAVLNVEKVTTLDVAIAQVALVSETAPYRVLDDLAERLEDRLTALPGVREAERWGVPEPRVDVALDLGRLARLDLPPGRVLQAIGGESADLPAGRVEAGARSFNVRTSGSYESPEEVAATVVGGTRDGLIRVRDVAQVSWGYADSTYRARFNGRRAVFVTVTQQEGQNIGAVRDRVWAELDQFEATLPAGIKLERGFDQSRNVAHRLTRLARTSLIAIGLVLVTLLPLGSRAAGIVMVSHPALARDRAHPALLRPASRINQLSIVGFVIALGLLVDDSIVVVENITRFLRGGPPAREAAIAATRQIAVAVLGAPPR